MTPRTPWILPRRDDGQVDLPAALAEVALLRELPAEAIVEIAAFTRLVTAFKGQTVLEEGDRGADLYILLEGRVRVQIESINPAIEVGISKLLEGDVIGEMALVEGEPRSATVVAVQPSIFALIPAAALDDFIQRYPAWGVVIMRNIARILSRRLKTMNRRLFNYVRASHF
jgi:CRP-like cAMP-binding protein